MGEAVSGPRRPRIAELIFRSWDVGPDADCMPTEAFEEIVRAAVAAGLVREWDDGRGRCPWYEAKRGAQERRLLARCEKALGRPHDEAAFGLAFWRRKT